MPQGLDQRRDILRVPKKSAVLMPSEMRRIACFEALLRWQHAPQMTQPDAFLRIAEQSDLMNMLGSWVLREACSVAARWSLELSYQLPSGGVVPYR
jgi:EAL domain-containing protein (putative c-di-GMP-specific phosphodiesterase class I)